MDPLLAAVMERIPVNGSTTLSRQGQRLHRTRQTTPLQAAIGQARQCLLDKQQADGHWVGELQGDTILESEYILLMAFLGREHEDKVIKAAQYLREQQLPEGGWN